MRCANPLLLTALLLTPSLPALALPSDSEQPIRIQANSATLDDRNNTAVYTGNVIVTQGTMRLTGNRVTLNTDANGEVSKIVSVGSPATYRQTPREGQTPINARGLTIEYHADVERIILIEQAFLEQDSNTFRGEYVTYDIQRQVVDAGRAPGASGPSASGDERIEIIIQPRRRSE
ncbi:lipopolysaccharide transport periplasmic protein LptA [Halopseudomonas phragmitis]|uniref:Lipopolysaccharide export system protein LptA n=2 Tax=Pseudomonadaceae TaxID=135621 RepID=A0A1V0B0H7_9GAMM|nr:MULTISPECIES: lipopolysaccharide transport periplasmic protein LptA [Pseudomonadaceae]AQZ93438.1 lipopolysaccharide transport periplasmic protein LptA [Halopseudomonas phragmitis]PAU89886.1 lipopolysaccharide transport periplasmic protein LptA [Pseudomonas sp. WN033]RHW19628.1 lipopolysaccharide transport periplasmic protein LptA [Pseudomonas jilinensis]